MTEASAGSNGGRPFGIWRSTALVIGNMIGSGIFLLPATLAAFGGISIFGWLFSAAGAMCLALVFAKLSSIIPKPGGHYAYTREGFGDFAAFIVAWGYWISLMTGNAAIAVAMVGYLGEFFPFLKSTPAATVITALSAIWLLTWINALGVRNAGLIQVVTVILKLVPLVAIATLGLLYFNIDNFTPFNVSGESHFMAITATAALTLWAFLGLESACVPAGEITNPEKTCARATIIGVTVTGLVYVMATVAVMGIIPVADLANSTAPFADAAREIWGEWAAKAIAAGAAISCFGALNGWILLTGQYPLAVANDGLFPKPFAKMSRRGTPALGLVISLLLVTVMVSVQQTSEANWLVGLFKTAILMATFTSLVPYAFSSLAQIVVISRDRKRFQDKSITGTIVVAVLAFAFSLWAIVGAEQAESGTVYWGTIFLLLGIPVYLWVTRKFHTVYNRVSRAFRHSD